MNNIAAILFRSFVKPFYRENAGSFFFFVTVMFFCVGPLNGAGLAAYHYSLIMGMLQSPQFLLLVCIGWLLYVRKAAAFVSKTMADPSFSFLQLLNATPASLRLRMLLVVQCWLFAPVLIYGCVVTGIAFYHHYFLSALFLLLFFIVFILLPAVYYKKNLQYPGTPFLLTSLPPVFPGFFRRSYPGILLRFILDKQKFLLAGIKLFTCLTTFGMLSNISNEDYDLTFPFLFFNFGMIANGLIIYRVRVFEEKELLLYRNMPVSLLRRWLQYALVYGIMMLPEIVTLLILTPLHIHAADAWRFALCGFSLLMLMNSIAFLDDFTMKGYLRVMLVILCVQYFFLIASALTALFIFLFLIGLVIFFSAYYSFEKNRGQIGQ